MGTVCPDGGRMSPWMTLSFSAIPPLYENHPAAIEAELSALGRVNVSTEVEL